MHLARYIVLTLVVITSFSFRAQAQTTDPFQLWSTPDTIVDVVAHYPEARGPRPAIIILPGQSYHKELRLVRGLAEFAAKNGFVVLRFDWSFFYNKEGEPSKNLAQERADVAAVLKFAQESPRVQQNRIYLVGKSLGSVVAANFFVDHGSLRALVLLTPLLQNKAMRERFYGRLSGDSRSVLIVSGTSDKYAPEQELSSLGQQIKNSTVMPLPGNHSLNLGINPESKSFVFSRENVELAIRQIVHWIEYDDSFSPRK